MPILPYLDSQPNSPLYSWSKCEVIALCPGTGIGADTLNERELQFLSEKFAIPSLCGAEYAKVKRKRA